MELYIDFMEKHPNNTDAYIVKNGTIEENFEIHSIGMKKL